jgi:hypothetical protein
MNPILAHLKLTPDRVRALLPQPPKRSTRKAPAVLQKTSRAAAILRIEFPPGPEGQRAYHTSYMRAYRQANTQ